MEPYGVLGKREEKPYGLLARLAHALSTMPTVQGIK
jgi:hypothetical protein